MVKSQMNARFFTPIDQIIINRFLATFNLALDTNHIHNEANMLGLPCFLHETLANALNSRR